MIDEFRGLLERVKQLEVQVQSSRKTADALKFETWDRKSQILSKLESEVKRALDQRRETDLSFLRTDDDKEYFSHIVMQITAQARISEVLRQIESVLASDEALSRSLTVGEHSWIIERIGSFEVVKLQPTGRELRGELPLLHPSILDQFLRRCGGGRFTILRHSQIQVEHVELEKKVPPAEGENIDAEEFLKSISVQT